MNLYKDLLTKWCDALIELQYQDNKWPGLSGGILCPACSMIHGRCGDAVYPFMYLAHQTGDQKYLNSAIKVMDWSNHVSCDDGSFFNDTNNDWKGITAFSALSLGEALHFHGEILDNSTRQKWMLRLRQAADFLYSFMTKETGNINYPITCATTLAVCWKVLEDDRYLLRAKELAHASMTNFTSQNKLIFGEGHHFFNIPNGCEPIDLGYNVEESLPALVLYAKITDDTNVLDLVVQSMKSHLEFMLPDGGWDNSWGSRNYKWTYWGSRTSDGCQTAYALMAEDHPEFAEAALRNTKLLATCTHDGILYGGLHNHIHEEIPCIHHTFCHAKALASILDYNPNISDESSAVFLPREKSLGIKEFPEIKTLLLAKGSWRATVTGYDFIYTEKYLPISGGSICMLWHENAGPVLSASLTDYKMLETQNMQMPKTQDHLPLTPRLEYCYNGINYVSTNSIYAAIDYIQNEEQLLVNAKGTLLDNQQNHPPMGKIEYEFIYILKQDSIEFNISTKGNSNELTFYLPLISNNNEDFNLIDIHNLKIKKQSTTVHVNSNHNIIIGHYNKNRIFNYVPGFEALSVSFKLKSKENEPLTIKISIS